MSISNNSINRKKNKCNPARVRHTEICMSLLTILGEEKRRWKKLLVEEGNLPSDWKLAYVTPIYKNKGAHNLAINYRPVSLTSVVCKLMETMIRKHITEHLISEKLLSNKQYGFINKRSTVTQLISFIDMCCESTAKSEVVDCIYFDFAKAFDTVPHRRLMMKLERYG
eukprot:TCONS_00020010-protein